MQKKASHDWSQYKKLLLIEVSANEIWSFLKPEQKKVGHYWNQCKRKDDHYWSQRKGKSVIIEASAKKKLVITEDED